MKLRLYNTAIIERIIGKNESTDWKAFEANSIPEICPIVWFSKTPENTIANEVNKQRIPVKKVSSNATKPCEICSSKLRDRSTIMVLKDTKDIIAVENMGEYNGLYHSLNGLISPMDGIGPDNLTIDLLEKRLDESVKEIILATSFTPSGETTAIYLEKILSKDNLTISRLGYGLPAGGDIEYVDELTLKRALSNRTSNK